MPVASDNVWIGDLPVGMDKASLVTIFEPYGQIVECRCMPGKDEDAKVSAMIRFASVDMATWVCENLNENIPEGLSEPIIARFANASQPKGGSKGDNKSAPYSIGGAKGAPIAAKGAGFVAPAASDNVWVGDLPVGTDKPDLAGIFEAYGQIVDCRMLPGRDPEAKPCAMIRFVSTDMASWVVENLNGNIPQGLAEPIIVRFANSSGGGGAGKGGGGGWQANTGGDGGAWAGGKSIGKAWAPPAAAAPKGGKGGKPGSIQALFQSVKGAGILGGGTVADECQCFVKNLPPDTSDFDLYKLFSPFGAIPPTGVKAMMNADGTCKGIGFVDFTDPTAAATAVMALDGHDGIGVSTKKPSLGKGGGKGGKKGKFDN